MKNPFSEGHRLRLLKAKDERIPKPMSGNTARGDGGGPHRGDLDLQRFRQAQAFLCRLQRRENPTYPEQEAWQWFMEKYDSRLAPWLKRYHLPKEDHEDCLQDIRLEVVRMLPAFVSDGTERGLCSWLHRIVHGKVVDCFRNQRRVNHQNLGLLPDAAIIDPEEGPVAEYEHHLQQEVVQRILGRLRQRISGLAFQVFFRHWIEEKTIANIAGELNLTERAVRRHLSRGKQMFTLLAEMDEDRDYLSEA